jgi:hypothetical protein
MGQVSGGISGDPEPRALRKDVRFIAALTLYFTIEIYDALP